ncbi:MAG: FecR family protein [Deltaproteobacteria bacterium]
MKIKTVRSIMPFLLIFSLFYFAASDTAFSGVLDEYTAPKHVVYKSSVWTFEFDLDVDFSSDGTATAKISNVRKKHDESWADLSLTANILKIRKSADKVSAYIEINLTGHGNHFSAPFVTADDPSTWTWSEGSKEPYTDTMNEWVMFPYDMYPELADIEHFEPGAPTEFSVAGGQSTKPDSGSVESGSPAMIDKPHGRVKVKKASGGDWIDATKGMELEIGDMVKTLSDGTVSVVLFAQDEQSGLKQEVALIRVKPDSEFVIPKDTANTEKKVGFIKMVTGFLWARAKKDENSLKVATPNAICGVRGTEFEVDFKDNITCVTVMEGTVWLAETEGLNEHIITAGNKACIPAGGNNTITPQSQSSTGQLSGTWKTNFGLMTLTQDGTHVTGSYPHDSGKIEGTLAGNVLRGRWSESPSYKPPKDAGDLEFTFSEDGRHFTGTWRYGSQKQSWDGKWTGQKQE